MSGWRRLVRDGAEKARREHGGAHLQPVGRLAARVRQLHLLCKQRCLGRRDGSCRAHTELSLSSAGRIHMVLDQGRGCLLCGGGCTGRPRVHRIERPRHGERTDVHRRSDGGPRSHHRLERCGFRLDGGLHHGQCAVYRAAKRRKGPQRHLGQARTERRR